MRIPFELSNAPAAFQRSMEEILNSLQDECCIPYLDGILYYAKTFEDHVEILRCVLRALQQHSVKLRPTKYELFKKEVPYIGRLVSADGVQRALDHLIHILSNPPVLGYPDFDLPFVLHMDASQHGRGAVLYKRQGGKLRVIAYDSSTLTPAERNYNLHSGKLEFLALKWAISVTFRDYLFYAPHFIVYTDNNPLTYVMSTAKLNAVSHRWVGELASFRFEVKYRPGKANVDADTLSRLPLDGYVDSCMEELPRDTIVATWEGSRGGNFTLKMGCYTGKPARGVN